MNVFDAARLVGSHFVGDPRTDQEQHVRRLDVLRRQGPFLNIPMLACNCGSISPPYPTIATICAFAT